MLLADGRSLIAKLKSIAPDKVKLIDQFLLANPSHADRDFWVSYKNTLETFDTSTVTYPLTTSWEKYCADNGITYKSMLELP